MMVPRQARWCPGRHGGAQAGTVVLSYGLAMKTEFQAMRLSFKNGWIKDIPADRSKSLN